MIFGSRSRMKVRRRRGSLSRGVLWCQAVTAIGQYGDSGSTVVLYPVGLGSVNPAVARPLATNHRHLTVERHRIGVRLTPAVSY